MECTVVERILAVSAPSLGGTHEASAGSKRRVRVARVDASVGSVHRVGVARVEGGGEGGDLRLVRGGGRQKARG